MKRSNLKKVILRIGLALVVLYALLALLAPLFVPPADSHPFFEKFPKYPVVIAHRGGKGLWPENTLFAFYRATEMGVDILEMDLRSTADDVLVVIHDATVDRTTNGEGEVRAMNLEELQALDAGYRWSNDQDATYPYRAKGIVVPSLEEVFQAFTNQRMAIEIKPADPVLAAPLCSMIRLYQRTELVLVASFHDEVIQQFRRECPEVATSASESELRIFFILDKIFLDQLFRPDMQAFQAPEYSSGLHVLTRSFISSAKRRNLQVHPWTINDTYGMQRLLALGVDGIITDYPDLMLALLGRR